MYMELQPDYRGFFAFCQAPAGGRFPSEPTAKDQLTLRVDFP